MELDRSDDCWRIIGVGADTINGAPDNDVNAVADNDRSINNDSFGGDDPGAAMMPLAVVALPAELDREHKKRVEPVLSTNAGAGNGAAAAFDGTPLISEEDDEHGDSGGVYAGDVIGNDNDNDDTGTLEMVLMATVDEVEVIPDAAAADADNGNNGGDDDASNNDDPGDDEESNDWGVQLPAAKGVIGGESVDIVLEDDEEALITPPSLTLLLLLTLLVTNDDDGDVDDDT
jgi:hypothetical protein